MGHRIKIHDFRDSSVTETEEVWPTLAAAAAVCVTLSRLYGWLGFIPIPA